MKKTILLAAMAACLFATNVFAQKIKGSDTCLPLTQTEAENFMNKDKAAKITVTGGGSGVGISALHRPQPAPGRGPRQQSAGAGKHGLCLSAGRDGFQ